MPVISTDQEVSAARVRLLPQRYKHFRNCIWKNYTEVGSKALICGDINLAKRMFSEALLEARKEDKIDYRLAVSLAHVGHTQLSLREFPQAANSYLRALAVTRNVKDTPKEFEIMLLETLADIRLEQGQLRLAKRHLARALNLRELHTPQEKNLRAKILLKMATIFSEFGDTDQALALYEKSKALRSQT
ncbi:MAG TPA: tetratricopeptide repeat protein [Candidatus Melainabacteria bacterium]|nr:tetratricopeptide repeat protein [Candidatus Melainabacteria bacterium]